MAQEKDADCSFDTNELPEPKDESPQVSNTRLSDTDVPMLSIRGFPSKTNMQMVDRFLQNTRAPGGGKIKLLTYDNADCHAVIMCENKEGD